MTAMVVISPPRSTVTAGVNAVALSAEKKKIYIYILIMDEHDPKHLYNVLES